MNAYYDDFSKIISNSRIIEGTCEDLAPRTTIGERLRSATFSLLRAARRVAASRFFAPATLAFTLVGVAAIVGAVERGALRLFPALLLGLSLSALEGFVLRRRLRGK